MDINANIQTFGMQNIFQNRGPIILDSFMEGFMKIHIDRRYDSINILRI